MKRSGLHPAIVVYALLAYLALALPLPAVLLNHELGLLTGNPAHTTLDDHAWLDHTAGSGLASGDASIVEIDLIARFSQLLPASHEASPIQSPSVRGPPAC